MYLKVKHSHVKVLVLIKLMESTKTWSENYKFSETTPL